MRRRKRKVNPSHYLARKAYSVRDVIAGYIVGGAALMALVVFGS